ncbi:MAG TPA: head GIN domain-containing protein [Flavobacteriaceae bacterium]|nr:head GIN domain-containing protein [Flavobacteriaceae bacterium]|tara:strand:- start:207 stop:887 length:681 start_codon:yes stop_codon:yes gene_type:complete
MKTKILFALLVIGQTIFSQNETSRKIGDFKILKVYDLVNIELVRAEENYAEIKGEHSNSIVIKNKNGELKVRMGIERRFRGANTKVKIFYNNLEKIYVHEGAFVYSKDTIAQANLYVKSDEGARVVFNLNITDLSTNTSSGAIMDLQGKAQHHRAKVNTGGELQASSLKTEETDLYLTTGGLAEVFAVNTLNINVRAGGTVNVHSKTRKIVENKLVGGTINYIYEN